MTPDRRWIADTRTLNAILLDLSTLKPPAPRPRQPAPEPEYEPVWNGRRDGPNRGQLTVEADEPRRPEDQGRPARLPG